MLKSSMFSSSCTVSGLIYLSLPEILSPSSVPVASLTWHSLCPASMYPIYAWFYCTHSPHHLCCQIKTQKILEKNKEAR